MRAWLASRDGLIVVFSLLAATYEIGLGGARPVVLTFLSGLILSPVVMRIDSARDRSRNNGNGAHRRTSDDDNPEGTS